MFTRLTLRLRFLPLGIFWGVVTAMLNVDNFSRILITRDIEPVNWLVDLRSIFVIVGPAIFACLIATLLGSAILRREFSPILWSVNWVVIGVSSCVGGVAISGLASPLLYIIWQSYQHPSVGLSTFFSSDLSLILGGIFFAWFFVSPPLIAPLVVQSIVFASSSLPVALVVRRLMIGAGQVSEPAGGESQTQP